MTNPRSSNCFHDGNIAYSNLRGMDDSYFTNPRQGTRGNNRTRRSNRISTSISTSSQNDNDAYSINCGRAMGDSYVTNPKHSSSFHDDGDHHTASLNSPVQGTDDSYVTNPRLSTIDNSPYDPAFERRNTYCRNEFNDDSVQPNSQGGNSNIHSTSPSTDPQSTQFLFDMDNLSDVSGSIGSFSLNNNSDDSIASNVRSHPRSCSSSHPFYSDVSTNVRLGYCSSTNQDTGYLSKLLTFYFLNYILFCLTQSSVHFSISIKSPFLIPLYLSTLNVPVQILLEVNP